MPSHIPDSVLKPLGRASWSSVVTHACSGVQAANVLVNTDGRVVLSDFGVTASLERAVPSPRASGGPRSTASPTPSDGASAAEPRDLASAHSGLSALSTGSVGSARAADDGAAQVLPAWVLHLGVSHGCCVLYQERCWGCVCVLPCPVPCDLSSWMGLNSRQHGRLQRATRLGPARRRHRHKQNTKAGQDGVAQCVGWGRRRRRRARTAARGRARSTWRATPSAGRLASWRPRS